jgi:uroporphyrin-III C-methyltransferase/precorrin-2 dehydrogenase/sirohydrochlorin ferrochelatase
MRRFPAFLDLQRRAVVIIGGGASALRRARLAIAAGAKPRVVWPVLEENLRMELEGRAMLLARAPEPADFDGAALVFIAVDDDSDAARWAGQARRAGALVNAADRPELCDFIVPSIVDRGRVTAAIATDGAAPVLARNLRAAMETLVPARAGALAEFADHYRPAVKGKFKLAERRAFWEDFFAGPIAAMVLAGEERRAHEAMIEAINRPRKDQTRGVVHLVGAGPGDPDLLTVKALRLLQTADVILYDRLVSDAILARARRDAERIDVGKAKGDSIRQSDIEEKMIAFAREGKTVLRLKGGDPFIFGRGGEELDALRAANVPAFVTPGVTAAMGAAASAGMALTHRDFSQSVTFVTGHAAGDADPDLDWTALAALKNTLVIYMGVGKAAAIAANLIEAGRAPETPVAVVENATRTEEKIVKGALADLPELMAAGAIHGPAIIVIGEVAALANGETLLSAAREARRVA